MAARRGSVVLAILGVCLLALAAMPPGAAQSGIAMQVQVPEGETDPIRNPFGPVLPPEFVDTVVAEVPLSTGLAFLPDGRLVVSAKVGQLYLVTPGGADPILLLDLSGDVCDDSDRGMSGVTVDPAFAENGFVYVYYTYRKFDNCDTRTEDPPVNRAVRYVLADDAIDPESAVLLLDEIPTPGGYHEGGDLHFGPDGFLYISVGDGGCYYAEPILCQVRNPAAREGNTLHGKIVRITRDGDIPPTNPFAATGDACRLTGGTAPGRVCAETFATGFRNPFRFAIDPNPGDRLGRIFVNDVGNNDWEEVNEVTVGADYGWNVREGFCRAGGRTACGPSPAGLTDPVYAYLHEDGCVSITGAAFVPDGIWTEANTGAYLFADYGCGTIFRRDAAGVVEPFATGLGAVVSMTFGPDPEFGRALFYARITEEGTGEIHRLAYAAGGNLPPFAQATLDQTAGGLPLPVAFDASASADPEGAPLTYGWDFGDGSPAASGPRAAHTYTVAGTYAAVLTVTDAEGGAATREIRIDAGNTPPVAEILAPTTATRFAVGDTITLQGEATDAEDGPLPPSALSWEVIRHHDTHTHPFLSATTEGTSAEGETSERDDPGTSGGQGAATEPGATSEPVELGAGVIFVAPEPEDLLAVPNSYLEIILTATDANGLATTVRQRLDPRIVTLTVATDPPGLVVAVDGVTAAGPAAIPTWAGSGLEVATDNQGTLNGPVYVFTGWSDGGAASHPVTTPSGDSTLTASFGPGLLAIPASAAARVDASQSDTNFAGEQLRAAGRNEEKGTGPIWTYLRVDVGGIAGPPVRATLWLYAENGSRSGPSLWTAADAGWPEAGITWNNRPRRSSGIVADGSGVVPQGGWVAYDVTGVVTENGVYSFVLVSSIIDGVVFAGRDAGDLAPMLVIDGPAGDGTGVAIPVASPASAP